MNILLPPPPKVDARNPDTLVKWAQDIYSVLSREFEARTPDTQTRNSLLLTSPSGYVWEITVSDVGAITATKVYG